jgi:hypothetical protein
VFSVLNNNCHPKLVTLLDRSQYVAQQIIKRTFTYIPLKQFSCLRITALCYQVLNWLCFVSRLMSIELSRCTVFSDLQLNRYLHIPDIIAAMVCHCQLGNYLNKYIYVIKLKLNLEKTVCQTDKVNVICILIFLHFNKA